MRNRGKIVKILTIEICICSLKELKKIVYFMEVSCLQIRIILLFPLFCFIIQKIMLNLIAIQLLIIWSIVNHKFYVEIQNVSNIHIITYIYSNLLHNWLILNIFLVDFNCLSNILFL